MKRVIWFVSLSLVFLGFLLGLSFVPLASEKDTAAGKKLFETRCAACHGLDAKGSLDAAKSIKVDPLRLDLTSDRIVQKSTADLYRLISSGHGKMPKHKDSLTPKQIQSLIDYLRTLQKAYVQK